MIKLVPKKISSKAEDRNPKGKDTGYSDILVIQVEDDNDFK